MGNSNGDDNSMPNAKSNNKGNGVIDLEGKGDMLQGNGLSLSSSATALNNPDIEHGGAEGDTGLPVGGKRKFPGNA